MRNVYEAPSANLGKSQSHEYSLYKITGIGIATFLGSILAGGFLMYLNFKRLGLIEKANKTLIYSSIATVIVFIIIFLIPEDINIPNTAFSIPQIIAMVQIAKHQQGGLIETHAEANGPLASNWKAFGIGLLFTIAIMAVIFGVLFFVA
jgi:amino acid transporter